MLLVALPAHWMPSEQGEQLVCASAGPAYVPAPQAVQLDTPAVAAIVPGRHGVSTPPGHPKPTRPGVHVSGGSARPRNSLKASVTVVTVVCGQLVIVQAALM